MPYFDDAALLRNVREEPPTPIYLIYGKETY